MYKNQDFLRKVRLCLYLIFGLGQFSCTVLHDGKGTETSLKTYRISMDLLPGYEESCLITALNGTVVMNIDRLPFTAGRKQIPEQFTISVKVKSEEALQRVLSQLQFYGLRVRNAAIQN